MEERAQMETSVTDNVSQSNANISQILKEDSDKKETAKDLVPSQLNEEVSHSKPGTSKDAILEESDGRRDSGEDKDYDSEPGSTALDKTDSKKRLRNTSLRNNQGKTMYPKQWVVSKEMRELRRSYALLEKNLKIEGLQKVPEPPKFRKRRYSVGSGMGRPHDKDVPYKRKRLGSVDFRPKKDHMPKWEMLGGDSRDPLNLNGLAHSEEGRLLNLKTPESSPLPTPDFRKLVYVKVPPNIEDPLNLEGKHDQRVLDMMLNATFRKRHRSKKKHDRQNMGKCDKQSEEAQQVNSVQETNTVSKNKIASSTETVSGEKQTESTQVVDTETGAKGKTCQAIPTKPVVHTSRSSSRALSTSPDRKFKRQNSGGKGKWAQKEPSKFPAKPMFIFGNYNRYYGYRNKHHEPDPRLQYLALSWFKGKDVLDIGCNVGHITLALAEQFHPRKILGMDIDGKLIQAARQKIRHMLSLRRKDSSKYPSVFEMTRGPLEAHPLIGSSDQFPNNILFLQGNYVPGSEEILHLQKEEFDTILALSITKWIHLHNGDHGLKLFFQKIFRQLRPGGRLVLEPQPWATYRKRAKLSPELFNTYQAIKLKPEGFKHYLLSIGFVKCEVIGVPVTKAKGFRRPLILFTKADSRQNSNSFHSDSLSVCTECGSTDPSSCCHEFTGLRRGAYASYMYDHISYPRGSTDYSDPGGYRQPDSERNNMICTPDMYGAPGPLGLSNTTGMDNFFLPVHRRSSSRVSSPSHQSRSSETGNGSRCESGTCSSSSSSGSSVSSSSQTSGSSEYSASEHDGTNSGLVNGLGWNGGVSNGAISENGLDFVVPEDGGAIVDVQLGEIPHEMNGDIAQEVIWVENPNVNANALDVQDANVNVGHEDGAGENNMDTDDPPPSNS